jgi:hypothetical protein
MLVGEQITPVVLAASQQQKPKRRDSKISHATSFSIVADPTET